jgi:hypothetical protein
MYPLVVNILFLWKEHWYTTRFHFYHRKWRRKWWFCQQDGGVDQWFRDGYSVMDTSWWVSYCHLPTTSGCAPCAPMDGLDLKLLLFSAWKGQDWDPNNPVPLILSTTLMESQMSVNPLLNYGFWGCSIFGRRDYPQISIMFCDPFLGHTQWAHAVRQCLTGAAHSVAVRAELSGKTRFLFCWNSNPAMHSSCDWDIAGMQLSWGQLISPIFLIHGDKPCPIYLPVNFTYSNGIYI